MKPHPRIRKTVKWGGPIVAAVLGLTWVASAGRWGGWQSGRGFYVGVVQGRFEIRQVHEAATQPPTPFNGFQPRGWQKGEAHGRLVSLIPSIYNDRLCTLVTIPLLGASLLSALLALAAWKRDAHIRRRDAIGRCVACGYDLRGLAAAPPAVCPECGAGASDGGAAA